DKQTALNELNQVKGSNRKRYLDPVATVAERDSAYPTPDNGDSVWVSGEGKMYRYNGTEWKVTNENDPSAIDMVNQQLADMASITHMGGRNDGTVDIASIISSYAAGKTDIHIYLPAGIYRWDKTITLTNKR